MTSDISVRLKTIVKKLKYDWESHLMATFSTQKVVLSLYLCLFRGTPLPPSSTPRAFLIIVMGCMGNSKSHSWPWQQSYYWKRLGEEKNTFVTWQKRRSVKYRNHRVLQYCKKADYKQKATLSFCTFMLMIPQGAVVSAVLSPVARFSLIICSLLYNIISKCVAAGGSSFSLSIYWIRTASSFSFLQVNLI